MSTSFGSTPTPYNHRWCDSPPVRCRSILHEQYHETFTYIFFHLLMDVSIISSLVLQSFLTPSAPSLILISEATSRQTVRPRRIRKIKLVRPSTGSEPKRIGSERGGCLPSTICSSIDVDDMDEVSELQRWLFDWFISSNDSRSTFYWLITSGSKA